LSLILRGSLESLVFHWILLKLNARRFTIWWDRSLLLLKHYLLLNCLGWYNCLCPIYCVPSWITFCIWRHRSIKITLMEIWVFSVKCFSERKIFFFFLKWILLIFWEIWLCSIIISFFFSNLHSSHYFFFLKFCKS